MKLIHVFNFALVSKRFHFISRAYKYFLDKLRISKHIISFDFHYLLFLLKELLQLNKEIFNNENIHLEQILGMLNVIAVNCCLYLLASNSQMREAGIMTLQSGLNLFVKNSLIN